MGALSAAESVTPVPHVPAPSKRSGVIAGSGDDDESLPRLAIAGFGALVLAGAVIALVAGVRRRR
jgi:hypothetical protein